MGISRDCPLQVSIRSLMYPTNAKPIPAISGGEEKPPCSAHDFLEPPDPRRSDSSSLHMRERQPAHHEGRKEHTRTEELQDDRCVSYPRYGDGRTNAQYDDTDAGADDHEMVGEHFHPSHSTGWMPT